MMRRALQGSLSAKIKFEGETKKPSRIKNQNRILFKEFGVIHIGGYSYIPFYKSYM
jgi:hypothetical protein